VVLALALAFFAFLAFTRGGIAGRAGSDAGRGSWLFFAV
jgi:hypothetical protein